MSTANEHFSELVTQVAALIDILLETFVTDDDVADADIVAEGIIRYARQVESLAVLAEAGECLGLTHICMYYQEALTQLADCRAALNETVRMALEEWPTLVMAYLEDPTDADTTELLVAHLQNPAWVTPLSAEHAEVLQQLLAQPATAAPPEATTIPAEGADESGVTCAVSVAPDIVPVAEAPEDMPTVSVLATVEPPDTDCATVPESPADDEVPPDVAAPPAESEAEPYACDDPVAEPAHEAISGDVLVLAPAALIEPAAGAPEPDAVADAGPDAALDAVPEAGDSVADPAGPVAASAAAVYVDMTASDTEEGALPAVEEARADMADAVPAGFAMATSEPAAEDAAEDMPYDMPAAVSADDPWATVLDTWAAPSWEAAPAPESVPLDAAAERLVDLLRVEVSRLAAALETLLDEATAESWPAALTDHAEEIECLGEGAAALGLQGLHQASACLRAHLLSLAAQAQPLSAAQRQLVSGWPGPVLGYLQGFHRPAAQAALVQYLQDPHWPQPLSETAGEALREALYVASLDVAEDEQHPRQRHARLTDIALSLPEDVNPALLDSLLQDLPQQAADFSMAVQRLTSGTGTLADVDAAQRVAHTLKGAANTVGIPGIANLTHHLEDILVALAEHGTLPSRALNQTLTRAADSLEAMSETLVGLSSPTPAEETLGVLQEVLDWANMIDQAGVPDDDTRPRVRDTLPALLQRDAAATPEVPQPERLSPGPGARVSATLVDELLRLASEAMVLNGQLQDRQKRLVQQMRALHGQNNALQQLVWDLEQLVDVRGVTSPLQQRPAGGAFDPLEMEQYSELHTVSRRLLEAVTDAREMGQALATGLGAMDGLLTGQRRVQQDNEETIMRLRMVPVKTVAQRLQRSVRQACRLTGKEAELLLSGAETLIDNTVLNSIIDPLMHLLRNAVDHGIETSEAREALGKPRVGTIALDVVREGNTIVVRCHDDGAGLDYAAIRHSAVERGLIEASQVLSEEELSRLILRPGFSTRAHTTQVSGRGIGMDAVYSQVQALKGSLHLTSVAHQGCRVEMRLPVSLMSTHGLLVRVGREVLAVSSLGVEQILYPGAGTMVQAGHATMYQVGEDVFATTTLEDLLNLPPAPARLPEALRPALLVREDVGRRRVVFVPEVLGSLALVVKNLGRYVPPIKGVIGATILGDGSATPVLDMPDLLRRPAQLHTGRAVPAQSTAAVESSAPRALVVDDSLSARRALAEFVRDLGFEVQTASDGLEAVTLLERAVPDILLVDLEMPRMNGLELTAHVRSRPATMHLPVVMVTSRSTDKHRRSALQAGVNVYLVKPFAEDVLATHVQRLTTERRAA